MAVTHSVRFMALLALGAMLFAIADTVLAGSAQWLSNPTSGDWNTTNNWMPATIPNATTDVATFDSSSVTGVSPSATITVDSIVFNPAASAFTITLVPTVDLTLDGAGITNNSGNTQNFATVVNNARQQGRFFFHNSATAGINNIFTNNGGTVTSGAGGTVGFSDNSSAASATFYNNGGTVSGASGGITEFFNSASAGGSSFINSAGTVSGSTGGVTEFFNTSTAAGATLQANGGTGGGGSIIFRDDSTGGTAKVVVFAGISGGIGAADISVHNPPGISLGSIEGNRGKIFLGSNNLTVGSDNSSTIFSGSIQDGGAGGGTGGSFTKTGSGTVTFTAANTYTGPTTVTAGTLAESSSGAIADTSTLTVKGPTAIFNLNALAASHSDTVATVTLDGGGSITGTGTSTLTSTGSFEMKSGSVSAILAGSGIALNKTSGGTVSLTGANTYSGATTVSAGFLTVVNDGTTTHGSLGSGPTTVGGDGGNGSFGVLQFQQNANVGSGVFTTSGGSASGAMGGFTEFFNTSSAGSGTFTNNGATANLASGGTTEFLDTSSAGNGTFSNTGGANGGGGGTTLFLSDSTGGTARIKVFGNAFLDISMHNAPGISTGSIEGSGFVALGANTLTVGSNNLSTDFLGTIQDGGSGGALNKVGNGSLELSGTSTYTGPTTVSGGLLIVSGSLGNTAVTVASGGELSGYGTLNGPLTINNGGIVDLSLSTLTLNGNVVNNGLFILRKGAQPAGSSTSFINNGTLDIMDEGVAFIPPAGFVNNGVILDSSLVTIKTVGMAGTTVTVTIDSYTGHTYQLQGSSSLAPNSFSNLGPSQQGATGTVLTFTDSNASGPAGFYRIALDQ